MNEMTEALESINWGLLAPFIFLQFLLMIVALIDCLRQEHTNGPKWMWILVIAFVGILGPVIYFILGRRNY